MYVCVCVCVVFVCVCVCVFSWVGFYGISTIVGYLSPVYTYILNIYNLKKECWR